MNKNNHKKYEEEKNPPDKLVYEVYSYKTGLMYIKRKEDGKYLTRYIENKKCKLCWIDKKEGCEDQLFKIKIDHQK